MFNVSRPSPKSLYGSKPYTKFAYAVGLAKVLIFLLAPTPKPNGVAGSATSLLAVLNPKISSTLISFDSVAVVTKVLNK